MKRLASLLLYCALVFSLRADVLISEFMASNASTLADEDGQFPDWIELYNSGSNAVNLLNWSLTDNATNLKKWQFPSTNIAGGGFLVVFASGKNRTVAGATLHTNFKLAASGDYLALIEPDGVTIATQFAPTFPPQFPDISYGLGMQLIYTNLVTTNSSARVFIPTDGGLGTSWTTADFDDSSWISGTNGVGYDTGANESEGIQVAPTVLAAGPAAYWRLNEPVGSATATNSGSLGDAANGVYLNGVTLGQPGERPTAFPGFETNNFAPRFDGTNDLVEVPFAGDLNAPVFTIEVWAKIAGGSSTLRSPLSSRDDLPQRGYSLYASVSNKWEFWTGQAAGGWQVITGANALIGAWTHLVGTYDGAIKSFYVNGALIGAGATVFVPNTAQPLRIGAGANENPAGQFFFNGNIDEVAVYGRALSADEVLFHYQTATNRAAARFNTNLTSQITTDVQAAMLGVNSSAYIRLPFVVPDVTQVDRLNLRMKYDDGFAAYLNGHLVALQNTRDDLTWNSAATLIHPDAEALVFEEFPIADIQGSLRTGTNVLAIQGLNRSATNPDFLILAQLEATHASALGTEPRYFLVPTPGGFNGIGTADLGPIISNAKHTPNVPLDTDDLVVTANVRPSFNAVTNVTLRYRIMFGPTNSIAMLDDGLHGDGAAGDGSFGATIPTSSFTNGQMIRYSIVASDALNNSSRWPLFEDPLDSEEYLGTVVADPALTSQLPIFHLFISAQNMGGADSETGGRASFFFDGEFYDNIEIHVRGNSTAGLAKKSHHLTFNHGHLLRHPGADVRIRNTSVLAEYVDPAYLRQNSSLWFMNQAGVPGPFNYPVRLQLNGDFYELGFHSDSPDAEMLARLGYDPNGALYKAAGNVTPDMASTGVFEKRTRTFENDSDYLALANGINEARGLGARRTNIFDMLDLPNVVNYLAVARITSENDDVWANMTLYRDTLGDKLWRIIPFDLNLSWGQLYYGDNPGANGSIQATNDTSKSHPFYGGSTILVSGGSGFNRVYDVIIQVPEARQMLLRRMRTLMDQFLQPPSTHPLLAVLNRRMSALTNLFWTEAFLDRQKWGWPPVGGPYGFGPNQWLTNGVSDMVSQFVIPRRSHLYVTHSISNALKVIGLYGTNNAGIPLSQPADASLVLAAIEYNPASGNQAEEYLSLTNPNPYAVDVSGWKLDGGVQFTFKPGTVVPSNGVVYLSPDVNAFRARANGPRGGQALFVQGPYKGQLSARGEALVLSDDQGRIVTTNSYAGNPSLAQQYLRITEIMYHPAPLAGNTNSAEAFEFIELKNIGPMTLDLTGVHFTNGIGFTFTGSSVTTLAPGQTVLVVKNIAAFTARYGGGFNIAGEYSGQLDNAGEKLQLDDAVGEKILEFTYDNAWYRITDGFGFSLVIRDPAAAWDTWSLGASWRPSAQLYGSPGADDPPAPSFPPIVVNELLSHPIAPQLDTVELRNLGTDSPDLGGWFLTDDFNTPKKYRMPEPTVIAPESFLLFDESSFNPTPSVPPSFAFSAHGDQVYLFSGDATTNLTGYFHGFKFGAAERGVSFGRYITSIGAEQFVAQKAVTLFAPNAGPLVGPVVISEIMYHPPDLPGGVDNELAEYLELRNITAGPVSLADPNYPTNTWRVRGTVDLNLPPGHTLAAGAYALIVNFDPVTNVTALGAFRAQYGVDPSVPLFGPYNHKLANSSGKVELLKPDAPVLTPGPDFGTVPYILVDEVDYSDSAPWPAFADGFGASLQRIDVTAYGNDPINWAAAAPSAAKPFGGGQPPLITQQPIGQTVVGGANASFTAGASGTEPLTYQWRFGGINLASATNPTLLLTNVQLGQDGDYDAVVMNSAGVATSLVARLSLVFPAYLAQQPQGKVVPTNANVTFSVSAIGTGSVAYQWRFNGADIAGATSSAYNIPSAQLVNDGIYTVVITDAIGSIMSQPAVLHVFIRPVITLQPLSQSVVPGGTAVFSAGASGTFPLSYRWRQGSKTLTNLVLNQNLSFLTLRNVSMSSTGSYSVIVTNLGGSAQSVLATLALTPDSDGDGLPDWFELLYGLNPNSSNFDPDGDGMTNLQEYIAGTDPLDGQSYLKVNVGSVPGGVQVWFAAVSNRTYTVQYNDSAAGGTWLKLKDVPARETNRVETVLDVGPGLTNRFYRLATPVLP